MADMSTSLRVAGSNPPPPQIRTPKAEAKVGWTNQPVADERDCSSCDLEVMSQSLILPPTDRPYFLLLQGYDQSKARHADRSYRTQTLADSTHTHTRTDVYTVNKEQTHRCECM